MSYYFKQSQVGTCNARSLCNDNHSDSLSKLKTQRKRISLRCMLSWHPLYIYFLIIIRLKQQSINKHTSWTKNAICSTWITVVTTLTIILTLRIGALLPCRTRITCSLPLHRLIRSLLTLDRRLIFRRAFVPDWADCTRGFPDPTVVTT